MSAITIRSAHNSDEQTLARLARMDSARSLSGDVLLAEVCGEAVAAIDLETGRAVADPFRRTADVVALLKLRASGSEPALRRRWAGALLPRAA